MIKRGKMRLSRVLMMIAILLTSFGAWGGTSYAAYNLDDGFESGSVSAGWNFSGNNTTSAQTSIVRSGDYAARFYLNRSTDSTVYRSEITPKAGGQFDWGQEYWMGFSFYLKNWGTDASYETNFQIHSVPSDWEDCRAGHNPITIYTGGGNIYLSTVTNPGTASNPPSGAAIASSVWSEAYTSNTWYDWVVHLRISTGSNGIIELWRNGELVYTQYGPNTDLVDECGEPPMSNYGYMKLGIYKWDWITQATAVASREMFYDNIRTGRVGGGYTGGYAGVDPSAWGGGGSPTDTWTNTTIAQQNGKFTINFDARPSSGASNGVVGLSDGASDAFTDLATSIRFNVNGNIDARNGSTYAASSTIGYSANTTYRFRMVVDVPNHKYSVYVTPSGGSEQTIGTNYDFRTQQSSVTQLNRLASVVGLVDGGAGTLTVSNLELIPIAEDFASSSANFTAASGGTWSVSGGKYALSSPADAMPNGNISVHQTSIANNFTLTAEGKAIGTTNSWNDFSVIFGYQDTSNYYFASFNENATPDPNTNGIFKYAGGTLTKLATFTQGFAADTAHSVKVERTGSTIKVYVGGNLVGTVTDSTFTSGKVGFGSRNDAGQFDNLIVKQ